MTKADIKHIDEFTDKTVQPLADLYERLNNQVIGVISNRLREIGEMTPSDVDRLVNLARIKDLEEIEQLLADATEMTKAEIDNIVQESANYNDELYDELYVAKGKPNLRVAGNKVLQSIASYSAKNMVEDVLNLSHTTAIVIQGKAKTINKAYVDAVNFASYQVKFGMVDYYTAIRQTVANLSKSGVRIVYGEDGKILKRVVDFKSGYSRRLDSQVRMNVLDGVRLMNAEYREQQGKEFGADGVELSAHGLCAEDHQFCQGRQYSNKEYEDLNNNLERPIGTMNCSHFPIPIVLGVSIPTYMDEQLQEINDYSNKPVTYELMNGEKKTVTRVQASQVQRRLETDLRRLKERKLQFDIIDDKEEIARLNRQIREKQAYYKKISEQVGLKYHPERARVYKSIDKYIPQEYNQSINKRKVGTKIMLDQNKSYSVKDWFADKIAQEVRSDISEAEIFDVLKETDKAVYAMVSIGYQKRKTMWIPKSALVENEVGKDTTQSMHYKTNFIQDYDEAVKAFKNFWDLYS